jgi:hypothetical protein
VGLSRKEEREMSKSNYRKELCKEILPYFEQGMDVPEVAKELGISKRSFYRYIEQHEEFKEAYEEGKALSEAWWLKQGREAVSNPEHKINATIWIFAMKNKFGWRDKQDHEHSGPNGRPIQNSVTFNFVGVDADSD